MDGELMTTMAVLTWTEIILAYYSYFLMSTESLGFLFHHRETIERCIAM